MDFKVGDYVVCIKSSMPIGDNVYVAGRVYRVTKVENLTSPFYNRIMTIDENGYNNGWLTRHFILGSKLTDLEKVIYGI